MIAAFYTPETGQINFVCSGPREIIDDHNMPYIEVPDQRDWALHYVVMNGELVERTEEEKNQIILPTAIVKAKKLRSQLLSDTDWVELPSASRRLTPEKLQAYETYRQALRDVPQQSGFPHNIVWPDTP